MFTMEIVNASEDSNGTTYDVTIGKYIAKTPSRILYDFDLFKQVISAAIGRQICDLVAGSWQEQVEGLVAKYYASER